MERREADRRALALEAELECERRLTSELATDLAGRLRELFSQLPGLDQSQHPLVSRPFNRPCARHIQPA